LVRLGNGLAGGLALVGVWWLMWPSQVSAQVSASPAPTAGPDAAREPPAHAMAAPEPLALESEFRFPDIAVHGFVSQGAFLSTDNDYLGHSERGSFEFLEAAVNVSTEPADRLRVGVQLFTRDVGAIGNYQMVLDWAFLDYRWREWLGVRAGRIKMPFGLYNEFSDVDAARLPVLLPQSVYPVVNRAFQLAQTGVALYGGARLGAAGAVEYQLFAGAMFGQDILLDLSAQVFLDETESRYAAGGQVFWRAPLPGLRAGFSVLRTDVTFHLQVDPFVADQFRMLGAVPPDFDGTFRYGLRDVHLLVGSAEYTRGDWMASAEYSRWLYRIVSSIPTVLPEADEDNERFYGMLSRRLTGWFEAGAYYSVVFVDASDRGGSGDRFSDSHRAFQRDLAISTRFDVNDFWLWKVEGHYMDGTADLPISSNPDPTRRWGFFLVKTTVSF
jgi:hypothetical protein